jgi:3-hydroxyisobutyrate dehydrogenase-like beta-hydroxyacid dehydrogenase
MQANERKIHNIAVIGFGEAGGIIGGDLAQQGCIVTAYDILYDSPNARAALQKKAQSLNVRVCATLADAIRDAELIVSAVTASSARDVARTAAKLIKREQWFLDINSVSPQTKAENALVIETSGARYVEAAVMAPVLPQRLKVPMLLGGPHANVFATKINALGMNAKAVSEKIGVASAIKMCRSIMIKGLEALTVECMFAARRYHAEDAVLASLHASFPSLGFDGDFPDYLISRVAEHGRRRAMEMRDVADTLRAANVQPLMASATAERQEALIDAMEKNHLAYDTAKNFSWRELADRLAATK